MYIALDAYRYTVTSIVAIANLKGGVGKSTLALSLASTLHGENLSVLLIDADPQGTCRAWSALAADRVRLGIIDSPPRLGVESRLAMMAADLVVLPVTPGAADAWALRETISVFEEAQALRPELRAVNLHQPCG